MYFKCESEPQKGKFEIQASPFNFSPFNVNEQDKNGDYIYSEYCQSDHINTLIEQRRDKKWSVLQENPQFTIATPCIARLKVCR